MKLFTKLFYVNECWQKLVKVNNSLPQIITYWTIFKKYQNKIYSYLVCDFLFLTVNMFPAVLALNFFLYFCLQRCSTFSSPAYYHLWQSSASNLNFAFVPPAFSEQANLAIYLHILLQTRLTSTHKSLYGLASLFFRLSYENILQKWSSSAFIAFYQVLFLFILSPHYTTKVHRQFEST